MFDRVIAGIDGLDGGRDALELAKELSSGRLTLVGAYPVDAVRSRASLAAYDQLLRDDMTAVLGAAQAGAEVDADLVAVPDTSPARALHRVAEEQDADLIVVGSSRRGSIGRLLLGDVARSVLHHAPCPVAIAPRGHRAVDARTIAVGFDGSDEARAALDLGARLAADRSAALTVYVVWEDPPVPIAEVGWADLREIQEQTRAAADRLLAEALAALPPRTAGRVLKGRADAALADAAAACDLVIVGSRGWGAVRRIALGSTSDRLIHAASVPVLVVPRCA